jgi:apolipoprotein N-acyltransferase
LVAVFSPIAGVLRTFGATWIHVDFGPGRELPTEWSIPFMLGLGIVCAAIAIGAYQALRIYIRAVGRGYRAVFARGVVTVASAT